MIKQKMMFNRLLTLILTLLLMIISSCTSIASSEGRKNILIVNSYDAENPWTQSEEEGIKEGLLSSGENIMIFHEYMDAKHSHSSGYEDSFSMYLKEKYKNLNISVVVTTDDYATLFVKNHRQSFLSEDVPVVFCGVNDLQFQAPQFVGVYESVDIRGTIALIQSIHGDKVPIMLVTDQSLSSVSITKNLLDDKNWLKEQRVTFISENNESIIKRNLNNFKDGAVIFLLFNEDDKGNSYTYFEGLHMIRSFTDLPVYSVWDFYLGQGIVGGSMITKEVMGEEVSNQIKRLLVGDPVASLTSKTTEARNVLDYDVMTHYGLSTDSNFGKAEIINKPVTFWGENYPVLMLFAGMVFIFIVLIILLLNSIRQKNKYYQMVGEHKMEIMNSSQKLGRRVEELQSQINDLHQLNSNMIFKLLEYRKRAGLSERLPFILHEINASLATMQAKLSYLDSHSIHIERNDSAMAPEMQYEELREILADSISNCDIDLNHIIQLVGATKTCFSDLGIEDHRNYKIKGFVDSFWMMLKPTMKKKKVSFVSKIPEDISLFGNPGDFVTIIGILLGNSLRHGINGSADRELKIEVEAYASQSQVHLIYRDNGLGCSTEILEKEMHKNIEDVKLDTSGIGLFQLYMIITKIFHGTISISGEYNEGVQVRINIPKAGGHDEQ